MDVIKPISSKNKIALSQYFYSPFIKSHLINGFFPGHAPHSSSIHSHEAVVNPIWAGIPESPLASKTGLGGHLKLKPKC